MINILLLVSRESSSSTIKQYTFDQVHKDLQDRISNTKLKSTTDEFTFSQEDFMMWSVQTSLNLLQPFMDLLFEVCHIVLGLRPQCRHLESNIGKNYIFHLN